MKFCQNRLISGSVDGLINVFDVANGFDEDEGFLVSQQRCTAHVDLLFLARNCSLALVRDVKQKVLPHFALGDKSDKFHQELCTFFAKLCLHLIAQQICIIMTTLPKLQLSKYAMLQSRMSLQSIRQCLNSLNFTTSNLPVQ